MSLKTLKASISGTRFSTRNVGPNVMNVLAAMSPNIETDAADVDVGVEVFSGKLNTIDEFYVVLSDCISHEMKSEDCCVEILKAGLHLYENDRLVMDKNRNNIIRELYSGYSKMVVLDDRSMKES